MAKRKLAQLVPPLPKEKGLYRVDLPLGGSALFESHNDALRARIPADAAIAVEMEVDSAMKQWVAAMAAGALKQRHQATIKVIKMNPVSEAAVDAILDRGTSQRCASNCHICIKPCAPGDWSLC